jgi:hypothetical protein
VCTLDASEFPGAGPLSLTLFNCNQSCVFCDSIPKTQCEFSIDSWDQWSTSTQFLHGCRCEGDELKFRNNRHGQQGYIDASKRDCDRIRFCQKLVKRKGLKYSWVDICCIKKSDSFELQRSLASSMIYWYPRATGCYAYS